VKGRGKWGQFTINLRRRRTVPVTAGGRQVSEKGALGSKGSKGGEGSKGRKRDCAVYIRKCNEYVEID
jgi:hypothetical protein